MLTRLLPSVLLILALRLPASGQNNQPILEKASRLYEQLVLQNQREALKSFSHSDRTSWNYVPTHRTGASLKELDSESTQLLYDLLSNLMSRTGLEKTKEIIELEDILRETEGRSQGDMYRDRGKYYVNFYDQPKHDQPWALSFEGHHLSLNFTFVGSRISGTPLFMGANPAEVKIERSKGKKVLEAEETLGRNLVKSLDPGQRKKAITSPVAPFDIESGSSGSISVTHFEGIVYTELDATQKELLKELVDVYISKLAGGLADTYVEKIEEWGWESLIFTWKGGTEPGQKHYYKIAGPTLLIEYDNTQNNANHIHTVWRDSQGDFGTDLLKEHYSNSPHHR